MRTTNERCPLQAECERSCEFKHREPECSYYRDNARGDLVIADKPRDIETITGDILEAKRVGGEAILTIGRCLNEAKEVLHHGEWLPWLTEKVEFSERTAQNFMRLSREWSNPQTLADLGASKALALLALPPEEREQFMAENHAVDGGEKTVIDMSARELDKAIRERKEALAAAEEAMANAKAAEDARARMEADMTMLKGLLESAKAETASATEEAVKLARELEDLKAKPVEVAVMQVDQEALDKARAEAVAGMQAMKRLRALAPRYTYTDGRWLIRPPVNAAEIVAEGKALKHCVGGYADRHVDGITTILFLRDRTRPGRSLVTIEMRGSEIAQIHGWDDERTACKDNPKRQSPRKIYQEFLDGWLAWLEAGSKRNKQGYPVLPKKTKEGAA